jgi:ABC-type polysaccharide/polyol phosphate export permease
VHVLAASDFKSRHRRMGLGVVWAAVTPLFQGLVIAVVFSVVGRFDAGIPFPFALYVLTGVMPWQFFTAAMMGGTKSLLESGSIVQRVAVPRLALPMATVAANLYNLVFTLVALLAIVAIFAFDRLGQIYLLPIAVTMLIGLALGMALTLCTILVRYRDLDPFLQTVIVAWFWVTPMIYRLDDSRLVHHPLIQNLIRANPITGMVGMFRAAYVGLPLDLWSTVSTAAWTVFFLVLGWRVFTRREATIADFI